MPTVGPELPPHLAKRKRSIYDDVETPNSPPRKVQAAATRNIGPTLPPTANANPDELDVDSSDDDSYGPSLQSTKLKPSPPSSRSAIGPSVPLAAPSNPDELDVSSSDDDTSGPAPPAAAPSRRVLGPAPPPASLSELPSDFPNSNSSSDSDDYGPSLPPAPGSAAESAYLAQRAADEAHAAASASQPKKAQRDDWMLAPPTDSDWTSRVDPTKLKARKFASGKGAKGGGAEKGGVSAIWTETPEEKRRRLEDEVLGRKEAASSSRGGGAGEKSGRDRGDQETERRIREYNERNRGSRSLVEEWQSGDQEGREKEDVPSKRGFDREKDMALGGRVGHVQKKEMLSKMGDFGGRFQKGSYL